MLPSVGYKRAFILIRNRVTQVLHVGQPGVLRPVHRQVQDYSHYKNERTGVEIDANEIVTRQDAGTTYEALAAEYGVSIKTVRRIHHSLRPDEVKPRRSTPRVDDLARSDVPVLDVLSGLSSGKTQKEVAKDLNTTRGKVSRVVRAAEKAGYKVPDLRTGSSGKLPYLLAHSSTKRAA